MDYECLLENVGRVDASLEDVLCVVGEGEAVVVMVSVGCCCGRGAAKTLRERYSLKERLRERKAERLPVGEVAVIGCYDEALGKAVVVVVVVVRDGFWKDDVFMADGLLSLAKAARRCGLGKLFLLCDDARQASYAYDMSVDVFAKDFRDINVAVVNKFI